MKQIELQKKTAAKAGKIEIYYFENENTGLKKTLFHRIYVPLEPFNTGLAYESQPVETAIVMEWLNLNLKEPTNLDGINLISTPDDNIEVSIYIGSDHNPCDIKRMNIRKVEEHTYEVDGRLLVDFEYEGVAPKEEFSFKTQLELNPQIKE